MRCWILGACIAAVAGAGCNDDAGATAIDERSPEPHQPDGYMGKSVVTTTPPSSVVEAVSLPIDLLAPTHAVPPAPGAARAPDGQGSITFAISRVYLGDTLRDGTPDLENGWRHYGFDIDGMISNGESTTLCRPRAGATWEAVHTDGLGGADNSFGRNLLPLLAVAPPDVTEPTNRLLDAGYPRMLFDIDRVGSLSDYNPLLTRLHRSWALGQSPAYDGSDVWPIASGWLADPADPSTSVSSLPDAYLVGDVWVSGIMHSVRLHIPLWNFGLEVVVPWGIISMRLSEDRRTAFDGTIAAVIPVESLQAAAGSFTGLFDADCQLSKLKAFLDAVDKAADIMADGSQDPTKECDAVSIGIGFEAQQVVLGPPLAQGKAPPGGRPACPPAPF